MISLIFLDVNHVYHSHIHYYTYITHVLIFLDVPLVMILALWDSGWEMFGKLFIWHMVAPQLCWLASTAT
jgi:hypothetical protein